MAKLITLNIINTKIQTFKFFGWNIRHIDFVRVKVNLCHSNRNNKSIDNSFMILMNGRVV